jgi:hypothetical protein
MAVVGRLDPVPVELAMMSSIEAQEPPVATEESDVKIRR